MFELEVSSLQGFRRYWMQYAVLKPLRAIIKSDKKKDQGIETAGNVCVDGNFEKHFITNLDAIQFLTKYWYINSRLMGHPVPLAAPSITISFNSRNVTLGSSILGEAVHFL